MRSTQKSDNAEESLEETSAPASPLSEKKSLAETDVKSGESDSSLTHVTVQQAKHNAAYWAATRTIFVEQAALLIQRQWRKKHGKEYSGKYAPTTKAAMSKVTMNFLQEPKDDALAQQQAKWIKSNQWMKLNFDDAQFSRAIYQAFRLGLITANQVATAKLLHDARLEFQDKQSDTKDIAPLKQFSFEDKGPYDPSTISYATPEKTRNFAERLKKMPVEDQCYFTMNFSKKRDMAFLYYGLKNCLKLKMLSQQKKLFVQILATFLRKRMGEKKYKAAYGKLNEVFSKADEDLQQKILTEMSKALELLEPEWVKYFKHNRSDKDLSSARFLSSIWNVGEQLPGVIISPDYDPDRADSPLLSIVIPHLSAFSELQLAMHSEKDTSDPYVNIGQFSPRFIRELDDQVSDVKATRSARPVELTHPDLIGNPDPHTFKAYDFILSYHDLFHVWRVSCNTTKPIARYLRTRLEEEKGFSMSKVIWALTDLDYLTVPIREALKEDSSLDHQAAVDDVTYRYIIQCSRAAFGSEQPNDDYLWLLADFAVNNEAWRQLLGQDPYVSIYDVLYKGVSSRTAPNIEVFANFENHYEKMLELVKDYPHQSSRFYVLAFRFHEFGAEGIALCEALEKNHQAANASLPLAKSKNKFSLSDDAKDQKITAQEKVVDVLRWDRNKGLYFESEGKRYFIEDPAYDARALFELLQKIVAVENSPKRSMTL